MSDSVNKNSGMSEEQALKVQKNLPAKTIKNHVATRLPSGSISGLLSKLEASLKYKAGAVVHFASTYRGEGADHIAFETAWFAATHRSQKVLFIDVNPRKKGVAVQNKLETEIALDTYLQNAMAGHEGGETMPLSHLEGSNFYYATVSTDQDHDEISLNAHLLDNLFSWLLPNYDLIVLDSENALDNGMAATLAPVIDGTLLVVEAERTRMPVLKEMVKTIENSGGTVLGTIMNRRKYYIPRWLYGLLFKTNKRR